MADVDVTAAAAAALHLPDVAYVSRRRLHYFCVPMDAWLIVVRPGFLSTGADFVAWEANGEVHGVSDSVALEGKKNLAMALPTCARQVVGGMVVKLGTPMALSAGWAAACRRMAKLLDDCPAR